MTVVNLSPAEMKGFEASAAANPGIAKLYELIREHATQKGGIVLDVWRLHLGRIFGEPIMMTPDEVAKRLSLPLSTVTGIIEGTRKAVRPEWLASAEFRASPFADS